MTKIAEGRQHGIRTTYERHGCRCEQCCQWRSDYRKSCQDKPCSRCKQNPRASSGFCNACSSKYQSERRRDTNVPRRPREYRLQKFYGITVAQYDDMLKMQNGVCAICESPNPNRTLLAVDHDHVTGKVRSLLCSRCNTALGQMRDNPDILRRAATYLEVHQ